VNTGSKSNLAITSELAMMTALAHLGYLRYFSDFLWSREIIRRQEWAYIGFGITVLTACYSHCSSGDGIMALEPLVTFTALVISYRTRPDGRRF
jgi:hypothetical protein